MLATLIAHGVSRLIVAHGSGAKAAQSLAGSHAILLTLTGWQRPPLCYSINLLVSIRQESN